ncbi:MAG: hybrid sensor histidine kinase/response regulator [Verrucomicrobia bacterium]|nr:hybrid sensor histidine kinase/response regulator [Verrucomicrobiota bacterium]
MAEAPPPADLPSELPLPRVMAVDDNADALKLVELRLKAGGMQCFTFSDGPSALQFLDEQLVDVVVLDVMMPRMDGYEVCRRLKSQARTKDIPVIFLTAKDDVADKVRGLELGAHDYLTKPVQQQELLARTQAALRVKQLQDQLKQKIELQTQIHQLHQKMLSEHWQKTLGQLSVSLAHEMNNPLAAALGTVQLLKLHEDMAPGLKQGLETIDTSLQRAGQKLRSLLLVAYGGRQIQRVQLDQLVRDLVTLVNFQAVMSKVNVVTELVEDCAWEGVASDLGRALLYILNNAIEAAAGSQPSRVSVALRVDESNYSISVTDSGPGIAAAVREQIFDPFFTTKGPPHNGIGLYLAAEAVKNLGGRLAVLSVPEERRTEFCIQLPRNP